MSKAPRSPLEEALDAALAGIGPLALMVECRRFRPSVLTNAEESLQRALQHISDFRKSRESSSPTA